MAGQIDARLKEIGIQLPNPAAPAANYVPFVRTGMTDGLKEPPFAGEPEQVAADVVRAMDRGTPMIYTPRIWQLVMLVIRNLPRFVMRKVGF